MNIQRPIIITAIILLVNTVLAAIDFPIHFLNVITRVLLYLAALVIAIGYVQGFGKKILMLVIVVGYTYGRQQVGVWKYRAYSQVRGIQDEHGNTLDRLHQVPNVGYIDWQDNKLNITKYSHKLPSDIFLPEDSLRLIALLEHVHIQEIFKNEHITLFSYRRFIDNGYGLTRINPTSTLTIDEIMALRINGMEINGYSRLQDGWYRLSYT